MSEFDRFLRKVQDDRAQGERDKAAEAERQRLQKLQADQQADQARLVALDEAQRNRDLLAKLATIADQMGMREYFADIYAQLQDTFGYDTFSLDDISWSQHFAGRNGIIAMHGSSLEHRREIGTRRVPDHGPDTDDMGNMWDDVPLYRVRLFGTVLFTIQGDSQTYINTSIVTEKKTTSLYNYNPNGPLDVLSGSLVRRGSHMYQPSMDARYMQELDKNVTKFVRESVEPPKSGTFGSWFR